MFTQPNYPAPLRLENNRQLSCCVQAFAITKGKPVFPLKCISQQRRLIGNKKGIRVKQSASVFTVCCFKLISPSWPTLLHGDNRGREAYRNVQYTIWWLIEIYDVLLPVPTLGSAAASANKLIWPSACTLYNIHTKYNNTSASLQAVSYEAKYRKAAGLGHYGVYEFFPLWVCVCAGLGPPSSPAVMDFHVRMLSLQLLHYQ